jgi:hypothetical protein
MEYGVRFFLHVVVLARKRRSVVVLKLQGRSDLVHPDHRRTIPNSEGFGCGRSPDRGRGCPDDGAALAQICGSNVGLKSRSNEHVIRCDTVIEHGLNCARHAENTVQICIGAFAAARESGSSHQKAELRLCRYTEELAGSI